MDEPIEMRSDADLLNNLCDSGACVRDRVTGRGVCITRKLIAEWTGYSIQAISDFGTGKTRIPAHFWKDFLRHHFDGRIIDLFVPDEYGSEFVDLRINPPQTGRSFFKDAVATMGLYHEQQKYIAEILADGRVDELDAATVQRYADAYAHHRHEDAALHRAILHKFNTAQKGVSP